MTFLACETTSLTAAQLASRPDYRGDIAALKAYSLQTEQNLRGLEAWRPMSAPQSASPVIASLL